MRTKENQMIKSSGWLAKVSRVLIFTLACSMFMNQGWYKPNTAEAAISVAQNWTNPYNGTTNPGNVAFTVNAGTKRLLVLAVTRAASTAVAQTCSVTYGTRTMTKVTGAHDESSASQQHTWFFYLDETGLAAATNTNFVASFTGGTTAKVQLLAAVFAGVDPTTPIGDAKNYNSGTVGNAAPTFATSLAVGAGEQAVGILMSYRTASTTNRTHTAGANWSPFVLEAVEITTTAIKGSIANRNITTAGSESTVGGVSSATTTVVSMSAISIRPYVCSATAPSDLSAPTVAYNQVVLNWTADCANSNLYRVFRGGVQQGGNLTCSAGTMSYTDNTVAQNTSYSYVVQGDSGTCTTDSAALPVTTPIYEIRTTTGTPKTDVADKMVIVTADYTNDSNNNLTISAYWGTTVGSQTNLCGTSSAHPASPYIVNCTGLTNGSTYYVKVTYADADGFTNQAGTSYNWVSGAVVPANKLMHNSANLSSSYWSGSWGVPGGKYGEITCDTCHTKTTTNVKRIKSSITAPNTPTDSFPGSNVNFQSLTTSATDMGDDTTAHTTSTRICEVCHTQPSVHKYNQTAQTHNNNIDCTTCHKHNTGFAGDGPCKSCHNAAQNVLYNTRQVVGGAAGSPGDDFVRLSRHVTNGTATEIVTDYDCVICHAEADASKVAAGTGWIDKSKHKNGTTSTGTVATDRMVKLRNVDNVALSYDFSHIVLGKAVATPAQKTTMRDNMDTFCMGCHDANGASAISVNNTNPASGVFLNDTTTARSVIGANNANPNSVTVNLRPFNTSDNLRNGRDAAQAFGATVAPTTLGEHRTSTYGRVLNVRDQFNSQNLSGSSWASHHNLRQFALRYGTRNTTYTPAAAWSAYVTKEGVTMNSATGGEIAGLHCSDCHLNETNAHGARNAWYMNQSGLSSSWTLTAGFESDVAPAAAGTSTTTADKMCFRCHNGATYGSDTAAGTNARYDHSLDCAGSSVVNNATTQTASFGATCFACHGGTSVALDGARPRKGLGAIHGNNDDYNPGNGTTVSKRYRFMSGGSMRFYNPNGTTAYSATTQWEGTTSIGCYTVATASRDVFGGCTTHGSTGRTEVKNRARTLNY